MKARLETKRLIMKLYTIPEFSIKRVGPGFSPCIIRPPIRTADTALPGTPKVKAGMRDPPTTALFDVSEAITPSGLPVPNSSGVFELLFASS